MVDLVRHVYRDGRGHLEPWFTLHIECIITTQHFAASVWYLYSIVYLPKHPMHPCLPPVPALAAARTQERWEISPIEQCTCVNETSHYTHTWNTIIQFTPIARGRSLPQWPTHHKPEIASYDHSIRHGRQSWRAVCPSWGDLIYNTFTLYNVISFE